MISNGFAAPVVTSEAPDLAGARMERAATNGAAIAGENPAGVRVWVGGTTTGVDDWYDCLGHAWSEPNAPPRSGEASGKGGRRAGRRERQARETEGTQAAPKRGRAGRAGAGASASANASAAAGGQLACMRATQCGTDAAMQGACKRANRQVGRRKRHRSSDNGTTHHTDTVKGVEMATSSDAFGITSLKIPIE